MSNVKSFFAIWSNFQTLASAMWRLATALFDWRTWIRIFKGDAIVDVVFITNMRDQTDRKRYIGALRPKCGHFNGPRYWIGGVAGRTRALNITTEDLMTNNGRQKACEYFISAVEWAEKRGAKVILLAAGTKRLFGKKGEKLKELFPNIIFTIGDNGTMYLLREETFRALRKADLKPDSARIGVLGPYGLLGEMMVKALTRENYNVIGAGPNMSALKRIKKAYSIDICQRFSEMGEVDAIVACTHSIKIRLDIEKVEFVRRKGRKLLVIDVAEPSNFQYREYQKCKDVVVRQDAGNGYAPKLKYVLGAISYKMFRLTRGVTFGCFAEALSIASAVKKNQKLEYVDWFSVSHKNIELMAQLFAKEGFTIPFPRCFGSPVKSFNLRKDILRKSQDKNFFLKLIKVLI